ncbi:MAG: dockerin type I domain-containing protein [Rubripirellula sp.]
MGKRTNRSIPRKLRVQRRLLVEHLGERRVLAAITGAVFDDANVSFQKDSAEVNVPERLIYVDANNNSELDAGESFVLAAEDGTYSIPNLGDGTYLLRLFNGTQTQSQTFPVEATVADGTVTVADATQLQLDGGTAFALTPDSLVIGDLSDGTDQSVAVGQQLTQVQALPDGTLLIVGTDDSGETSWTVNPADGSVTPIDLSGASEDLPWSTVALDSEGRGVLLEQSTPDIVVRAVDASDANLGLQVTTTSTTVPDDTQVLASETGNRSVFAWSGSDGLQLSLWSNATASFITQTPIDVSGTSGLLAFDDASGLLAVRTDSGGVSVLDADADFATLHTLIETGPVAIDGARDLLLTVSPVDAMLKLINLRDGSLVADLAVDLSSVGQVSSLALGASNDSVVVLGAAGVTEVALRKAAANSVTISGGQDVDNVLFGVTLDGANTAPQYTVQPSFETNEDTPLTLPAPAALTESSDAEGDDFVLVQRTQASHGIAILRTDGSISYTPDLNFNGSDSVIVLLHDGRDASAEITLDITVNAVPDAPTGVNITVDPVPENLNPGDPIGTIEVIDADGANHLLAIDDPRFGVDGQNIIFIGGGLDFETEPSIPLVISATDPETNDLIEEIVTLTIRNANDPITDITPHEAFVFENAPGDVVTELQVHDPDEEQTHTFTVDDPRFIVEGFDLRLVPGVSVDFETEESIVVNVTATEVPSGGSFTQAITIQVRDLPEQPSELSLTNDTVIELVPGATVGSVLLDNRPPGQFNLTVDDPRFEVDENDVLKLKDEDFVERASQTEIRLSISAADSNGQFNTVQGMFVIQVVENETPFHNHNDPFDVDHGGSVSSQDALMIINYLNTFGPGPVGEGSPAVCYDVNADGFVTALDALLVLNQVNRLSNGNGIVGGEGEGEGEQLAPAASAPEGEQIAQEQTPLPTIDSSNERLVDASMNQLADSNRAEVDIPDHDSKDQFAENVDATLRLLSDETI